MNIFQRSSLDSTAKVPIKTEINKLTTVESSEPIPYDESAALIEDDNKHDSTEESLAKEVERRNSSSECQEFLSTRKDSLTLLSATFESILLVEKTPIIKSLQEKDSTIEEYVKIEQALRDEVKKLESFIGLCNTIQTNLDSDCKRLRSYVGELKEEKTTLIEKNAELNHKLIAAELRLEVVSGEKKQLEVEKSTLQYAKVELELQVEEEVKQAADALTELCFQIKSINEQMEKLKIDKTALEEDNVNLILQLKAVHNENTALVQVKSYMQNKHKLQLLTVNKEKKVLEVDNSALKCNIVKLKSRLRRDIVDAIIVTFLGFVFGLLLDSVSLTRWLRGQV